MDKHNEAWSVIHDLALIYLSMAYGADNALTEAELETIMSKLNTWQPEASRSNIQEVMMEVMAVYMQGNMHDELKGSVIAVKNAMPEEHRRKVLSDLERIASADGTPRENEASLIKLLGRIWEVEEGKPYPGNDDPNLHEEALGEWTLLHDQALIYLFLAFGSNGSLNDSELVTIVAKLHEWHPGYSIDTVQRIAREALSVYMQGASGEMLEESVEAVRRAMAEADRTAVLEDLIQIARADGEMHENEKQFLGMLAAAWIGDAEEMEQGDGQDSILPI